jgi:hypothetical protein
LEGKALKAFEWGMMYFKLIVNTTAINITPSAPKFIFAPRRAYISITYPYYCHYRSREYTPKGVLLCAP